MIELANLSQSHCLRYVVGLGKISKSDKQTGINIMNKQKLMPYVAYCLDDSLSVRKIEDMPENARFVVFQCGFEPLVVTVWSYLGVELSEEEAEDIAVDYLLEIKWSDNSDLRCDYIL